MTQNNPVNAASRKKWLSYLVRGVMAIIVAITFVRQFVVPGSRASNFPLYLGIYFLANGILSIKEARSEPAQRRQAVAALTSIIGGLVLIVAFPFSSYRESLIATDLGRYAFSAIVIVIGLLQVQGGIHMTPEPVLKRAHLVFGFLEILLGIVVLAAPVDWEANAVALVWLVLVGIYMLIVAHHLHSKQLDLSSPQLSHRPEN